MKFSTVQVIYGIASRYQMKSKAYNLKTPTENNISASVWHRIRPKFSFLSGCFKMELIDVYSFISKRSSGVVNILIHNNFWRHTSCTVSYTHLRAHETV